MKVRKKIMHYVKKAREDKGLDMMFLMLTNIVDKVQKFYLTVQGQKRCLKTVLLTEL